MKIQVESVSPIKKKISVSVPEERVAAEFDEAYRRIAGKAQVPGFRKGKVPRPMLEKIYAESVASEVYESLVRQTMVQAMEEHDLDAVAMPELSDPKHDKGAGFSFTASLEVKPRFEPKNYKGIRIAKGETEPKEEQVRDVLARVQDSHAVLKEREGAQKPVKGDFVAITIQGIDAEGNLSAPGEEPKEQIYEIGGEILQKDVEKAVTGLTIGGSAPVTVKGKTAEGEKEFHVRVTLKAIKEKILPSLDDAFAKSVGPFETLAALKTRITEDLRREVTENARAQQVEQLLKEVVAKNPVELPDALVNSELHQLIHGFWSQMERAGIKEIPAEYSEEKLREKMLPDARRRVHEQLVIEAIARTEKIGVADEEVTARLAEMAKAAKIPAAEFRAYYEKTNRTDTVRFHMLAQKTLDFLLSAATIK